MTDVAVTARGGTYAPLQNRSGAVECVWILTAVIVAATVGLSDPRTGLTLAIGTSAFALTVLRAPAGLAVLVASVPVQDAWPASVGGMSLTWTRLLLVCFLAGWVFRLLTGRNKIRTTSVVWAISAYCLALILSLVNAADLAAAAAEIYRWGVAAVVLLAGISVLRTRSDRSFILVSLAVGVVFSFGVALYQVVTDTGPVTFNQRGVLRAYGLFGEPNPFAAYLAMATIAMLSYLLLGISRGNDPYHWLTFLAALGSGIGCVSLVLTQSRGGILGFAAGMAVVIWFVFPRKGRVFTLTGIAFVMVGLMMPVASPVRAALGFDSLFSQVPVEVTAENFAAQERIAHWGAALRMWQDHPFFGVGAGNVIAKFREYTPEWRFRIPRGHAHSVYLQAAAQAGAIGLICYLAVLTTAWRRSRSQLAQAITLDQRAACCGALGVTAAIALHGVFEYVHVLSLGIVLSAIWASVEFDPNSLTPGVAPHGDD